MSEEAVLPEGQVYCNTCSGVVDIENVDICPHCGVRQDKCWKKTLIIKLAIGIGILWIFIICSVMETYSNIENQVLNNNINVINNAFKGY